MALKAVGLGSEPIVMAMLSCQVRSVAVALDPAVEQVPEEVTALLTAMFSMVSTKLVEDGFQWLRVVEQRGQSSCQVSNDRRKKSSRYHNFTAIGTHTKFSTTAKRMTP